MTLCACVRRPMEFFGCRSGRASEARAAQDWPGETRKHRRHGENVFNLWEVEQDAEYKKAGKPGEQLSGATAAAGADEGEGRSGRGVMSARA